MNTGQLDHKFSGPELAMCTVRRTAIHAAGSVHNISLFAVIWNPKCILYRAWQAYTVVLPSKETGSLHPLSAVYRLPHRWHHRNGHAVDVLCALLNCDEFCHFYLAMICMRGTSHRPVSVSVCLSQVGVLLKRLNVGSHKQNHTIAQELYFSGAKDLYEIRPGSPLRWHQMQVGWVKIGDFWQITGYISKTVQGRHIVSIKVE